MMATKRSATRTLGAGMRLVLTQYIGAGAKIEVWTMATDSDRRAAESLPHIYTVVDGWNLAFTAPFWHYENALDAWVNLTSQRRVWAWAYENQ